MFFVCSSFLGMSLNHPAQEKLFLLELFGCREAELTLLLMVAVRAVWT